MTQIGQFLARATHLKEKTVVPVAIKRVSASFPNTLKAVREGITLGEVTAAHGRLSLPKHQLHTNGNLHSVPSLYVEHLTTQNAQGTYKGVGTGLMRGIGERAFLAGASGHVSLEADGSKARHPAVFYDKIGYQPAFPLTQEGLKATKQVNRALQTFDPQKRFGYIADIPMEIKEGLGQEALQARKQALAKQQPLKETLNTILATAPQGTKAQTMHSVLWGGSILDETNRGRETGQIIISHPALGFPAIFPTPRTQQHADIWD